MHKHLLIISIILPSLLLPSRLLSQTNGASLPLLNPATIEDSKKTLNVIDSLALVRMGVFPDSIQKQLWVSIGEGIGNSDSLLFELLESYNNSPQAQLYVILQVAKIKKWGRRSLREVINQHLNDTSSLMAEIYLMMAKELFKYAERPSYNDNYGEAIAICDTVILKWPSSDAAAQCRALRQRLLMPEVCLVDDYRPYILPYAADEWALSAIRHRNTESIHLRLCPIDDTINIVHQWTESVAKHDDYGYHSSYIYIPPTPTGRYMLYASTDSSFVFREAIEVVFTDRYIFYDPAGRGTVIDSRTGEPIRHFKVYLRDSNKKIVATQTTDHLGCFDFSKKPDGDYGLYAPYNGIDLARGSDPIEIGKGYPITAIKFLRQQNNYKPGDTVHFAVSALGKNGVLKSKSFKVLISDFGDPIDTLSLSFDKHGYAEGHYILQKDCDYIELEALNAYEWIPATEEEAKHYIFHCEESNWKIRQDYSFSWDSIYFTYGSIIINTEPKDPPVDAGLKVERLKPSERHRINHSMFNREAEHSISEEEFSHRFPQFAYSWKENSTNYWETDTLLYRTRRHFDSAPRRAFALPKMGSGIYRATLYAYRSDGSIDSSQSTLYDGRMPAVITPIDVWIEDESFLFPGDTLKIHFDSWFNDVKTVYTVQSNMRNIAKGYLQLSDESRVVSIPIKKRMEGILALSVSSIWHGETSECTYFFAVGNAGKILIDKSELLLTQRLRRARYNDFVTQSRKSQPRYPERSVAIPSIWNWLDITPTPTIDLYCPGEYWRWGLFSTMIRLPNRKEP